MIWIQALEASGLGVWMRTSNWAYPFINVLHVGALIMLVGSMLLLDLRLMGAGKTIISVQAASRALTPLAVTGLAFMLISGFMLFTADAVPLIDNPLFVPKLVLIALGVLNALLFRRWWGDALDDAGQGLPIVARSQAATSLLIWLSATVVGRLLAYV